MQNSLTKQSILTKLIITVKRIKISKHAAT